MRLPWAAVAGGTLIVALGAAGLIRGAMPQSSGSAATGASSGAAPIVVTNPYVRPPVPPNDTAAAYFTVYNTTGTPDRLLSVQSGAGEETELHVMQGTAMVDASNGVEVAPHGTLVLRTDGGHVMIEHLIGTLKPGQSVDLDLTFQHAGSVSVVAPVIAVGAPAPGGSSTPASVPSGGHS